jgi:hypothetical protein
MKAFLKKIAKVKKRRAIKKAMAVGATVWTFKYGVINANTDLFVNYGQYNQRLEAQYSSKKTETDDQSVNSIRFKTGSGAVIEIQKQQNKTPEALKSALTIRNGDLGKSGPGPRGKADARKNFKAKGWGSTILPGVEGFLPQNIYCHYHENAPLSCKPRVKVLDGQFQDDGNNPPPEAPEDSQFDPSQYKGGPSPFKEHEYGDPATVAKNIGFNQPKRLNKSYDKHAEDCFGITANRKKENLGIFKGEIQNLAQSADEVYKGSYRYKDPAYIFLKEIDEKITAVIVNATDGEYITSINPTDGQMEDIVSNGNIGLDTRPSMELTLQLRGPNGRSSL